jgi:hypothetical protein
MNIRNLRIRIIERAHAHEAHGIAGTGIVAPQCHEALWATCHTLAPAAIGRRVNHLNLSFQELNAFGFDHCVQYKSTAGLALAPTAVTAVHEERFAADAVTNVTAGAAAFLRSGRIVGARHAAHAVRMRAVTSISICMRGSSRPAEIMVIAGRLAPKYLRSTGQQSENRSPLGTM